MKTIPGKLKKRFPDIDFLKLAAFSNEHQNRFYSRLESVEVGRDLGRNSVTYLLCSLQRSRILYDGLVRCLNNPSITLAYLALRAHMETTGSVAFFLKKLRQFYDGELNPEAIDETLLRLLLGRRVYPEDHNEIKPNPINVLTLIDSVDYIVSKLPGTSKFNGFREAYEWLSEFCHPNCFGQTIGVEMSIPVVNFHWNPQFQEHDAKQIINYMVLSCELFFHCYDECFSQIEKNEKVPTLIGVSNKRGKN